MTVKEFLNHVDIGDQFITIIIPLKDTYVLRNAEKLDLGDEEISDTEKVIFNYENNYSIREKGKYWEFGIEPCVISRYIQEIDVRESADNYTFVYNEKGKVWIVIN